MANFSEMKEAMEEVRKRIIRNRSRFVNARSEVDVSVSDLTSMPSTFGAFIATIDAACVADPTDPAMVSLQAEKDLLVSEFTALKNSGTNLKVAMDSIL